MKRNDSTRMGRYALKLAVTPLLVAVLLAGCATAPQPGKEEPKKTYGYAIEGATVVFSFDPKDYSVATNGRTGEFKALESLGPFHRVAVAGPFNAWNAEAAAMERQATGGYVAAIPTSELESFGFRVQFKFVIDGQWWVEPPLRASNKAGTGLGNLSANLVVDLPENRYIRVPNDLDTYWNAYFSKNDVGALDKIMQVLNWNDLYRERVERALRETESAETRNRLIADLGNLSIALDASGSIRSPLDLDLLFGLLRSDRRLEPSINEIEVIAGDQNELIRRVNLKVSAFGSLALNASRHPEVRDYILKNLKRIKIESAGMLIQQLRFMKVIDNDSI